MQWSALHQLQEKSHHFNSTEINFHKCSLKGMRHIRGGGCVRKYQVDFNWQDWYNLAIQLPIKNQNTDIH